MSFKNKFLCCFPLLPGCFLIGAICSLLGLFLLMYTFLTLPLQRLTILKTYYYTKYAFFLTTLSIYYSGLIIAGISTMYGVLKRKHTKLLPLLAALIAHPFMAFSYNYVYTTDWNGDHYKYGHFQYFGTQYFERNGGYIFLIGTIIAAYFAFCIVNGIKMIENEKIDRTSKVFDFKMLEFKSFFGILPLDSGGLVISVVAIILGTSFLSSIIFTIPFDRLGIQDSWFLTNYYSSLAISCIFFVALVIGGILMAQGVLKKNYELMKPLMITLSIQPTLIYFFGSVYSMNFDLNLIIVLSYIFLTIVGAYFALCIRSLRKITRNQLEAVDLVSEKF